MRRCPCGPPRRQRAGAGPLESRTQGERCFRAAHWHLHPSACIGRWSVGLALHERAPPGDPHRRAVVPVPGHRLRLGRFAGLEWWFRGTAAMQYKTFAWPFGDPATATAVTNQAGQLRCQGFNPRLSLGRWRSRLMVPWNGGDTFQNARSADRGPCDCYGSHESGRAPTVPGLQPDALVGTLAFLAGGSVERLRCATKRLFGRSGTLRLLRQSRIRQGTYGARASARCPRWAVGGNGTAIRSIRPGNGVVCVQVRSEGMASLDTMVCIPSPTVEGRSMFLAPPSQWRMDGPNSPGCH